MRITHVDLNDPSVVYDDNDDSHQLAGPIKSADYCLHCGRIFDEHDQFCIDCYS